MTYVFFPQLGTCKKFWYMNRSHNRKFYKCLWDFYIFGSATR
jgi:hypothetical protein